MRLFLCSLSLVLLLVLSGCDGGASAYIPPVAVETTAVADLPVSVDAQDDDIPTAVPDMIINSADAEHILLANIYERSAPAVVNIDVIAGGDTAGTLDLSGGSGFVYDVQGHIVTNAHVVNDAREITITFNDGYVTSAQLIGADSYSDVAVIRVDVDVERLTALTLGDSDTVRVGDRAIAIGNPFGLASSMTSGIVSALGRQLRSGELIGGAEALPGFQNPSIIQVDAQINPGNSGGPLLNSRGEVIGVNTAIRSSSGVFEGIGFAVPANTVGRVVPELIDKGVVNYPWVGISARGSEDGFGVAGVAEALNLPVTSGVLISAVTGESPADKSGLRGGTGWTTVRGMQVCVGGDIIVAIDEHYVSDIDDLLAYLIVHHTPGDTVNLRVVRGGDTFDVPLTLESRDASTGIAPSCGNG